MIVPEATTSRAATTSEHTPAPVWVWSGDLDVADVAALSSTWQSLLEDHPASVVIDLAGVTFLDCAVLSVLVRANNEPCTRLFLQGLPVGVQQLLQATGLGAAFSLATAPDPPRSA